MKFILFRYINENGPISSIEPWYIALLNKLEENIKQLKKVKENYDRKPQHDDISKTTEVVDEADKLYK